RLLPACPPRAGPPCGRCGPGPLRGGCGWLRRCLHCCCHSCRPLWHGAGSCPAHTLFAKVSGTAPLSQGAQKPGAPLQATTAIRDAPHLAYLLEVAPASFIVSGKRGWKGRACRHAAAGCMNPSPGLSEPLVTALLFEPFELW